MSGLLRFRTNAVPHLPLTSQRLGAAAASLFTSLRATAAKIVISFKRRQCRHLAKPPVINSGSLPTKLSGYRFVFFSDTDNLSLEVIFPAKPQSPFWSERKPEAKYGVSHFWLCGGQGGVVVLARATATRPCPNGKRPPLLFQYLFNHFSSFCEYFHKVNSRCQMRDIE